MSTQTTWRAVCAAQTTSGSSALATTTGPSSPAAASALRQERPSALISWWRSSWSREKFSSTSTSGRPSLIMSATTRSSVSMMAQVALRLGGQRGGDAAVQVGAVGVVHDPVTAGIQPGADGRGQEVRGRGLAVGARHHGQVLAGQQVRQGLRVDLQHHGALDRRTGAPTQQPGGGRRETTGGGGHRQPERARPRTLRGRQFGGDGRLPW